MSKDEDPRITEARRLLWEVTNKNGRQKRKENHDNMICKCGHKHIDHSVSYSINYTAGVCSECDCEHFIHIPIGQSDTGPST